MKIGSSNYKTIVVKKEEEKATIILNRPEVLNALNFEMLREINAVLQSLKEDESVKAVIFTGSGNAFSVGADIKYIKEKSPMKVREELFFEMEKVIRSLTELSKPTIAMVNGLALGGGCELALSMDMVIAAENAKLGLPELNVGLFPGVAVALLPRIISLKKSFELMYFADVLDAREAEKIGLINKCVPADQLKEETDAMVDKLLTKSPIALKALRDCVYACLNLDYPSALSYALDRLGLHLSTQDAREGIQAFLEKREPKWRGE